MPDDVDSLHPYRDLLAAGIPAWQIARQVLKHIEGLEALPADTPGRHEALELSHEFVHTLHAQIPPDER